MSGALKVKMPDGTWVVVPTTGPQGPPGPPGADGSGSGESQEWHQNDLDTGLPGPAVSGPVTVWWPVQIVDMGDGTFALYLNTDDPFLRTDNTNGKLTLSPNGQAIVVPDWATKGFGSVLTINPYGDPEYLPPGDVGGFLLGEGMLETHDRRYVNNASITCGNQILRLSYLKARRSEGVQYMRVTTGNVPMSGTTPTTVQLALFEEDAGGALTRIAITANTPSLFTAANTLYSVPFTPAGQVMLTAGKRYACALLVVGAGTLATYAGIPGALGAEMQYSPRVNAQRTGVTVMPSGITVAQLNASPTGNQMYFALSLY